MECEHCGKTLSNLYSLRRHKDNERRCLLVQGRRPPDRPLGEIDRRTCRGCGKVVSRKERLRYHTRVCPAVVRASVEAEIRTELEDQHAVELAGYEAKIRELEQRLLIADAKLELQTANVVKQTTTTNNVNVTLNLAELTPELGLLLAEKITQKEFWEGQRAIGRALRDLRDPESRPFYAVKDENRAKYEVRQGEAMVRDDRAEKIIENVREPVREKIGTIKSDLIEGADPHFATRIIDQAVDCLSFSNAQGNARFLQGLSSKS